MRIRTSALVSATFFAIVDIVGVVLGQPVIRQAALLAVLLLVVSTVLPGPVNTGDGPPRWVLSAAFGALVVHAALTVPRAVSPSRGYQFLMQAAPSRDHHPNAILAGLNRAVETTGAPLLLVLALLAALLTIGGRPPDKRLPGVSPASGRLPSWPWLTAAGAGAVAIIAYAITSAADAVPHGPWVVDTPGPGVQAATLVTPVLFGLGALALAAVAGRDRQWRVLAAAALLAASTLPMVDMLAPSAVAFSSFHPSRGAFLTILFPLAPTDLAFIPALIHAAQFTAYLLLASAWPHYRTRPGTTPKQ